ncbi:MAG: 2-oxoacid:acceptor oxidoreductase family protein, partial [Alphaproteobacteria bacterium]
MAEVEALENAMRERQDLDSAVVRFAGDSGDGMQLTGGQFTMATAMAGNNLATFPDFPAEIRAPIGTTFGVSAFQINFGARTIMTSGDELDMLVAMNPAALKVNIEDLKAGGMAIVDIGAFSEKNLRKAGYAENPLENGSLEKYRVLPIDMSRLTLEAVKPHGLSQKDGLRCKNLWALGLAYWMYGRRRQATVDWLSQKFAKKADIAKANIAALNAGHAFGETAEMPAEVKTYNVPAAEIAPG